MQEGHSIIEAIDTPETTGAPTHSKKGTPYTCSGIGKIPVRNEKDPDPDMRRCVEYGKCGRKF